MSLFKTPQQATWLKWLFLKIPNSANARKVAIIGI